MATGVIERLRHLVDELAADDIAGVSQRDTVLELWQERDRIDAQLARRIGELDRSMEWSVDGAHSAAAWLAARVRTSAGDAHHRVKVAQQMRQMPIAAEAWQTGAIGSRHVDALTAVRHAAHAPEAFAEFEPALVDVAAHARPDDVARVGRQWRDALDASLDRDGSERQHEVEHERRGVRYSRSVDGLGFLDGVFDVEGAEIIETALQRRYEQCHHLNDARTPAQQRADATVDIFRHFLDQQGRGANRPHLMIVADPATVSGEEVGTCTTVSGYRLAPETVRRLSCDAIIQRAVMDADGVVLDLGRTTRRFTPEQYRAIVLRDGGCRMAGCDARAIACEAHHVIEWEDGGPTDLANGLALCYAHHRLVHEGGWRAEGDGNGELTWYDRTGEERGATRPRRPPPSLPTRLGREAAMTRRRVLALAAVRAS